MTDSNSVLEGVEAKNEEIKENEKENFEASMEQLEKAENSLENTSSFVAASLKNKNTEIENKNGISNLESLTDPQDKAVNFSKTTLNPIITSPNSSNNPNSFSIKPISSLSLTESPKKSTNPEKNSLLIKTPSHKKLNFPTTFEDIIEFMDDKFSIEKLDKKRKRISEIPLGITKSSQDLKIKAPIKFSKLGKRLYDKGKEFLNSAELKRQGLAKNECSFRPKINSNSEKMIKKAIKDGRDIRAKKPIEEPIIEELKENEEEKKKIKTKTISKTEFNEFLERNYKTALSKPKPEKTDKFDNECTFMPKIDEKSKELANSECVDLYGRAEEIEKKKKEKREAAIKAQRDIELKECTFQPEIIKVYETYSPQSRPRNNYIFQTEGYAKSRFTNIFY